MNDFSKKLLKWYSLHKRDLPWRDHGDPYAVWVAEIMLQQTRVAAVIPYYEKWMTRFPNIQSLAEATEKDVLIQWESLGYYGRARNIHKAARSIVENHNGTLPQELSELMKLPGIGRYTAGAIASMAFGKDIATLDGNIRRVLARFFNVSKLLGSTDGEAALWALAEENLPAGKAGDYNQAMMDLGATICLPKKPDCVICPLTHSCKARILSLQESLPIKKQKAAIPHHTVTAAVIRRGGKVLLAKRPSKGLLGGMWEFPGGKVEPGESLEEGLIRELHEELDAQIKISEPFGIYRHAYTHFRITLHAFLCELTAGEPKPVEAERLAWVRTNELDCFPMGKVDRQIARKLV
jgi:A/G-specific adenine glycosylase